MRFTRVVVIDRSVLAVNMFRMLFAESGARVLPAHRFEEGKRLLVHKERPDLLIMSSNVFGKKFKEILDSVCDDEYLQNIPKIFLCRNDRAEKEWREVLQKVPHASVLLRPFHPTEFSTTLRSLTEKRRGS